MSRKAVPGRSSLSFATTDGVLDIDHLLDLNPWKEIDDFDKGEAGRIQNVLNEFKDRLTLVRKQATKGCRESSALKNQKKSVKKTDGEKSMKKKLSEVHQPIGTKEKTSKKIIQKTEKSSTVKTENIKSHGNDVAKKGRSSIANNKNHLKENNNEKKVKQAENKIVSSSRKRYQSSVARTKSQATLKHSVEDSKSKTSTAFNKKLNKTLVKKTSVATAPKPVVKGIDSKKVKTEEATNEFETSTPKKKLPEIRNFVGKNSVAKRSVSTSLTDSKKHSSKELSSAKIPHHDDIPDFEENEKNDVSARHNNETMDVAKHIEKSASATKESATLSRKTIETGTRHGHNTKKHMEVKTKGSKGERKVGEFEKRLLEKAERKKMRKIRRHEKKAERAMEKFSHHVVGIVKEMGYLQEDHSQPDSSSTSSTSSSEESSSSRSDFSDSDSGSWSSSYSYTSCSCEFSSYRTDDQYSEYTLCSCSGCDLSSFTDTN